MCYKVAHNCEVEEKECAYSTGAEEIHSSDGIIYLQCNY